MRSSSRDKNKMSSVDMQAMGNPQSASNQTSEAEKVKKEDTATKSSSDQGSAKENIPLRRPIKIKTTDLETVGENESLSNSPFPSLPVTPIEGGRSSKVSIPKSRSMSSAEITSRVMGDTELAIVAERLKSDEPPLSLEEVRQRRASVKEDRKKSIEFIRSRTNSRAAALGRPPLEE